MVISIKISRKSFFLGSDKPRMLFYPLINVKMPTIVGILTFMSRTNFMLSLVEHEKSIITSGPDSSFRICKSVLQQGKYSITTPYFRWHYKDVDRHRQLKT